MDDAPRQPSPVPPPFDWSRFSQVNDPSDLGALPPPTAPPSPRGDGGGSSRRHPASRTRMAVAVLSGTAFAGLVGCTALSRSDGTATQEDETTTTADDLYGDAPTGDEGAGTDDGTGIDDGRFRPAPPDWGGSAEPGGSSGSSGSSGSTGSTGPSVRSQGS